MENRIKTIIREEIRAIKEEYQDKFKMVGNLVTNIEIRPQKEILSDIRAIAGITIVSEKEVMPYNEQDKTKFKSVLTVKVDGYPFIKHGGFSRDKMADIASNVRKVEGVIAFNTSPENISAI